MVRPRYKHEANLIINAEETDLVLTNHSHICYLCEAAWNKYLDEDDVLTGHRSHSPGLKCQVSIVLVVFMAFPSKMCSGLSLQLVLIIK